MQSKHISAVVIASFMVLMTFFSWGTSSSSASGYGSNFNFGLGISGLNLTSGFIALLGAIAGIVLPIIKTTRKFAIIPGIICVLSAVAAFVELKNADGFASNFNFSLSGASVSASVDPSWGIFAFTLFAIVYLVMSINLLRNPE